MGSGSCSLTAAPCSSRTVHAPARSLNPFRVLVTHRNFRIFWVGQTLSLIGTWMQSMASGWLALELSDSALLVGLLASIGSLPILIFSLFVQRYIVRGLTAGAVK